MAVIDPEFSVRGIESLRVRDCSIMPRPISYDTNARPDDRRKGGGSDQGGFQPGAMTLKEYHVTT